MIVRAEIGVLQAPPSAIPLRFVLADDPSGLHCAARVLLKAKTHPSLPDFGSDTKKCSRIRKSDYNTQISSNRGQINMESIPTIAHKHQ